MGLIPSRVKPMTLKLVFTASLLDTQHLDDVGQKCEEQAGKFTCCAVGKGILQDSLHLGVVDRWLATLTRARYSALIVFSSLKDKYATTYKKILKIQYSLLNFRAFSHP